MQRPADDDLIVDRDTADALTESPTILLYAPLAEDVERAIRYGRVAKSADIRRVRARLSTLRTLLRGRRDRRAAGAAMDGGSIASKPCRACYRHYDSATCRRDRMHASR